jgi:hypothetical protein
MVVSFARSRAAPQGSFARLLSVSPHAELVGSATNRVCEGALATQSCRMPTLVSCLRSGPSSRESGRPHNGQHKDRINGCGRVQGEADLDI